MCRPGPGLGHYPFTIALASLPEATITVNVHLDAAQRLAFKLFDSRHGSMTIEHILEFAEGSGLTFEAHPDCVPALFASSRGQIAAIVPLNCYAAALPFCNFSMNAGTSHSPASTGNDSMSPSRSQRKMTRLLPIQR